MHPIEIGKNFERTWRIVSHPRFLSRQGLGNEVPFFIDTYNAEDEYEVIRQITSLHHRLRNGNIPTVLLPMYDIVLEVLHSAGRLEKLFEYEKTVPRMPGNGSNRTFLSEMEKFADPGRGKPLQQVIARRLEAQPDHKLVLMYQLGTVFPYLRTHTLLSNLHSVITEVPLVVFFPGYYVSSEQDGYYFSLFGLFRGEYYRAFQLEDYIERGQIRADIE
jgi:hypothetical protein